MNRRRALSVAVLAAALAGSVAACSTTTADDAKPPTTSAAVPGTGTTTDIAFAQSMIPHHQQAVDMAGLALQSHAKASPDVRRLATRIQAAQDPEIDQMTGWLEQWQAPTVMPGVADADDLAAMDHGGHDMGAMTMSGMMTSEDMAALRQATGARFDAMWLQMMIAHHEGAVLMAEQVKAQPGNPEVVTLANQIIAAQQQEIGTMKQLLAS